MKRRWKCEAECEKGIDVLGVVLGQGKGRILGLVGNRDS